MRKFVIFLLVLCFQMPAHAHNVLASAYADGVTIEGEIGFSNGEMALPGSVVEVYVGEEQVGTAETDEEGFFVWQAQVRADHRFYSNLGAGHIADFILEAGDLPESLPGGSSSSSVSAGQTNISSSVGASSSADLNDTELARLVAKSVARQVKPLRKEIIALKEKASFRDALGGIGYIFGIFGIAAWLSARRKEEAIEASKKERKGP